jgi:hypothetical protein
MALAFPAIWPSPFNGLGQHRDVGKPFAAEVEMLAFDQEPACSTGKHSVEERHNTRPFNDCHDRHFSTGQGIPSRYAKERIVWIQAGGRPKGDEIVFIPALIT